MLDLDAPKGDPVITADAIPPGSAPDNFGPNDLPTTPPSLNPDDSLSDPVIPVGAQDPVAGPKNTVAEPSSLALLGIAASGIENARAHTEAQKLNQDLDQKVQELRALLDLVRGLTSAIEPEEIARVIADAADQPVLNGAVLHANLGQRER